jgi:hypothetical protein
LRMLNLLRAGWVLDFVFTPAEWQVQTQSGQRFFNSCGMLVKLVQLVEGQSILLIIQKAAVEI